MLLVRRILRSRKVQQSYSLRFWLLSSTLLTNSLNYTATVFYKTSDQIIINGEYTLNCKLCCHICFTRFMCFSHYVFQNCTRHNVNDTIIMIEVRYRAYLWLYAYLMLLYCSWLVIGNLCHFGSFHAMMHKVGIYFIDVTFRSRVIASNKPNN